MKKTFNINLAGYPFTIDEDAYNLLKDYLDTIRYAFVSKDDTEDIAEDIEGRVAEILIEKNYGKEKIVTIEEVTKVVERIGKPSEFIDIEVSEEATPGKENEADPETSFKDNFNPPPLPIKKRLFRDPRNSMLGGVCSGIAHYCGIDVTLIRLIAVLLFFLSGTAVTVIYIVLWIVIPEARTPLQRMQMMGQDTTMENIGKTVTGDYQQNEGAFQNEADKEPKGVLSKIFSVFTKCLIILGLVVALPLLFAFSIAAIGCVVALFVVGVSLIAGVGYGSGFLGNSEELLVFYILLAVIGGAITLGVPLWLFVRKNLRKNAPPYDSTGRRTLLLIWLCGLALLSVFTVKAVRLDHEIEEDEKDSQWLEKVYIGDESESIELNEEIGIRIKDDEGNTIIVNKNGISLRQDSVADIGSIRNDSVENEVAVPQENANDSISAKPLHHPHKKK